MTTNNLEAIRILAVDDDPIIRELYRKILTGTSATRQNHPDYLDLNVACIESHCLTHTLPSTLLMICESGEEAVELTRRRAAEGKPFQITLMDVRLGQGMDGIQAANRIRALDPDTQIIIVTGFSDYDTREIQTNIPPTDKLFYLQKPFQYQEILQFCTALYAKYQAERSLQEINRTLEARVWERTRELQELNSQLAEVSRRFQKAFYSNPAMMAIMRPEHTEFVEVNDAFVTQSGYTRDEIIGHTALQLGLCSQDVLEHLNHEIEEFEHVWENEITIRTRGGKDLTALISIEKIEINREPFLLAVLVDISTFKQSEEQMRTARARAESANQAKSDFLATISHEIRTPLNAIIGMTELVLDTNLDKEQRHYVEMVQSSSDTLLKLINDILDFSKIEAGKMDLDPISFNLRYALHDMLAPLDIRARSKGLRLSHTVSQDMPEMLVGDVGRLRQVLTNLVENGIKFTPAGEIGVTVTRESNDGTMTGLHIVVSDSGIGIPEDKQAEIYNPFHQADSSTTRRFGGTGLGLAICQKLVSLMGGHIWVESREGQGSRFHVTLRLHHQPSPQPYYADLTALSGVRVLLVEDDPTYRVILSNLLTSHGMQVSGCDDPANLIESLRRAHGSEEAPQILILDLNEPEQDIFSHLERVRKNPSYDAMAIILLRAAAERGDALRCKQLGVEAYLTKPVNHSTLLETLKYLRSTTPEKNHLLTQHSLRETPPSQNILVVEDNEFNLMILNTMLEKTGYSVVTARDGLEALQVLESQPIDLMVTDIQMPRMSGVELIRRVRQQEAQTGGRLPIIVLSAHTLSTDVAEFRDSGADDYLAKPVKKSKLLSSIVRCLAQARAEGTSPTPSLPEKRTPFSPPGTLTLKENNSPAWPPAPSKEPESLSPRSSMTVLIVDDVEENLDYMQRIITKLGFRHILARNGLEALSIIRKDPASVDLVFMDVQMPQMDGLEATMHIRRLAAGHEVPIIALTASLGGHERETCSRAGMDDYYPKPIRPQQVAEILGKWMPSRAHAEQKTTQEGRRGSA